MGFRIKTIALDAPPDSFPDPATMATALGYPEGLLAIGGDLSPPRLIAAYRQGIFPWYNDDQPILWWSPDPRAIIRPSHFHMSRSLQRSLRRQHWQYSLNQDFVAVITACAQERGDHGTWITPAMHAAYVEMHRLGYAHSVEVWLDGELAGGVYGIRLGQVFFGESMYSAATNGSKVALSALVQLALQEGITVIDCQMETPHLASLGMETLSRAAFLQLLPDATRGADALPDWRLSPQSATGLTQLRKTATC